MKNARAYYPILAVALSGVSGALLAFALPPRGYALLGWIAFLPLLLAARISRPLIAAGCGLLCSLACALIVSGPVTEDYQFGNLVAAFGGLGLVLAFAAGFSSMGKKLSPGVQPFFIACAGVTAELLSVMVFPISSAITQYQNPAMSKLASVTGIWGVSFLVWLVPAAIIAAVQKQKAAWLAIAIALTAVVSPLVVRFPIGHSGGFVRVSAIQAPDAYSAARQTRRVRGLANVVVWPEHHMVEDDATAASAAGRNGVYVVADFRESLGGGKSYNTAYLFSPDGRLIGKQRKRFPFGDEDRTVKRGNVSQPVKCNGFTAGMAICFDTQFTTVIRDLANKGADVILVPVHDPEMPNCLFSYLHTATLPFRAAENAVPIAAAEGDGLSCIIQASGKMVLRAGEHTIEPITADVVLRDTRTIASMIGDSFAYVCGLAMIGTLAATLVCKKQKVSETGNE